MVKVRFAPSPTGYLHVGNAKTALFNHLFARRSGGTFVLRMEDTDAERSDRLYEESITEDLRWLGVEWDEGPYRQSERMGLYRSHAESLLARGLAYKCFCTEEELSALRQRSLAKSEAPRYGGKCRDLASDEVSRREAEGIPFTLRFRSDGRPITFMDGIRGELSFPRGHVEDLIIVRRDGTPTYNLAVVVDDMDMGITHVIRGSDHISNTPKQIALFAAFGATPPQYAHHSLLIGADRKPLSKRHGATRVVDFRSMGILSEALVNYLCTMGRGVQPDMMNREELMAGFSLDSISVSDTLFDMEKLLWFNREYIKHMDMGQLMEKADLAGAETGKVAAVRENASTLNELRDYMGIFDSPSLSDGARAFLMKTAAAVETARFMKDMLGTGRPSLEELAGALSKPDGLKRKDLFMVLRAFITGRSDGPPLKDIFPLVPTDIITGRIDAYLNPKREG